MTGFVIALGHAPHLKLASSGREFSAGEAPMVFDSHDSAYDYVLQNTDTEPLRGIRAEIMQHLPS